MRNHIRRIPRRVVTKQSHDKYKRKKKTKQHEFWEKCLA